MTARRSADEFLDRLIERHFAELKFAEVTRALRALSANYVEDRDTRGLNRALEGRGKRAAFALYYGTIHFLVTRALVGEFDLGLQHEGSPRPPRPDWILDLGCGTGVCGAAWAIECGMDVAILGADPSSFALHEARWTFQALRVKSETTPSIDTAMDRVPSPAGVMLGWALNELDDSKRDELGRRALTWIARGTRILVVEPVSKRVAPWWDDWTRPLSAAGAIVAERRLALDLPPKIALLAKASGLSGRTTTVRVLVHRGDR